MKNKEKKRVKQSRANFTLSCGVSRRQKCVGFIPTKRGSATSVFRRFSAPRTYQYMPCQRYKGAIGWVVSRVSKSKYESRTVHGTSKPHFVHVPVVEVLARAVCLSRLIVLDPLRTRLVLEQGLNALGLAALLDLQARTRAKETRCSRRTRFRCGPVVSPSIIGQRAQRSQITHPPRDIRFHRSSPPPAIGSGSGSIGVGVVSRQIRLWVGVNIVLCRQGCFSLLVICRRTGYDERDFCTAHPLCRSERRRQRRRCRRCRRT